MQQTAAKALVRSYFYQEYLPSQLSQQLLRGGNHLVLLSEGNEEESELVRLGVPGFRVYSVENDAKVFAEQSQRARRGELKAVLYYGELSEFITHHLQTNQRFLVLNLDICGAYRNHIDPVMTPILLFARRNPRTVVATYSNAARDRPQLLEGMKSLAILHAICPEQTMAATSALFGRYLSTGLSPTVSFNMVLRNLFWVRSNLEHVLMGSVMLDNTKRKDALGLLASLEACWQHISSGIPPSVQYDDFVSLLVNNLCQVSSIPLFDLAIHDLTIVTYEAHNHFYHMGWFTTYQPVSLCSAAQWLEQTLATLTAQPLLFTSREANSLGAYGTTGADIPGTLEIWNRGGLEESGRQLEIPLALPHEVSIAALQATPTIHVSRGEDPQTEGKEDVLVTASQPAKQLTDAQKSRIQVLARRKPDATTDDVIRSLQLQNYRRTSITAHIALARRKS